MICRLGLPVLVWPLLVGLLLSPIGPGGEARAQQSELPGGGLDFLDQLGGISGGSSLDPVKFSADFQVAEGGGTGRVRVTADIRPNWHVYSLTQPEGGPGRARLRVEPSEDYQVVGPFTPDKPPVIHEADLFPVRTEEHGGKVVWTAPLKFREGVDPASLTLEVVFNGQACEEMGSCIPIENERLQAKYAGQYEGDTTPAGEYRSDSSSHVVLRGAVEPRVVRPGETLQLTLTAVPEPGWHVYALAARDEGKISKPTLIVLRDGSLRAGAVTPSSAPVEKETGLPEEPVTRYYEGPVTWTVPIQVPDDAAGALEIQGLIGYQVCSDNQCDPMTAAAFQATVEVSDSPAGDASASEPVPLAFTSADYAEVSGLAAERAGQGGTEAGFNLDDITPMGEDPGKAPIYQAILFALLGGFILNFMPCVLPVIGLKIMSFVQQAGESRAKVFALNLWYSAGMLAVFMVLATLAVVWNLSWGEQNNFDQFNIPMVAIVFAMGLSFLGVWEIPIPGFAASGTASELAEKEGPLGAFSKGIITTLLATPCSGPGIATALAWCNAKPAPLVYMVFLFMGVGMAAPYLIIGANPRLVKFIPKPGAWMETFKQVMGFVLLGTVIWILSYIAWENVLPTVTLLFGLWAAFWWIGRTPLTAELPRRLRAWAEGVAFACLIGWVAFGWLQPEMDVRLAKRVDDVISEREQLLAEGGSLLNAEGAGEKEEGHELPWQPFSEQTLRELTAEQKTVLIDFTADWCQTCKWLEKYVLNTEPVRNAVDEYNVVPLVANKSSKSDKVRDEIARLMQKLKSTDVPLLAIFPAGRPLEPIVLRGGYTQAELIGKLQEASTMQQQVSSR